jgi:hypothetical protein
LPWKAKQNVPVKTGDAVWRIVPVGLTVPVTRIQSVGIVVLLTHVSKSPFRISVLDPAFVMFVAVLVPEPCGQLYALGCHSHTCGGQH